MSYPPDFFPLEYLPGPLGHIPGLHIPGTLVTYGEAGKQQQAAQAQATEQARKKRRNHLLLLRR
jgi:hypothetical protein